MIFKVTSLIFFLIGAQTVGRAHSELIIKVDPGKLTSGGFKSSSSGRSALADQLKSMVEVGEIQPLAHSSSLGKKVASSFLFKNSYLVSLSSTEANIKKLLDDLNALAWVVYAHPNYQYEPDALPNDPLLSQQWGHQAINIERAWDFGFGSADTVIAVIGSGVHINHEDLAEALWTNVHEIPDNGLDDDLNGYVDDLYGWNFAANNTDLSDDADHETGVAGVIAATANNGKGISGVCPDCRIMPLKIDYYTATVAQAILYAVDQGAKVINMSFGTYYRQLYRPDETVYEAIEYAASQGVFLVATAGNDSISRRRMPAALSQVAAVGASALNNQRAGFSNWGSWVDVAAPGQSILTTSKDGGYQEYSGTSYAAPYLSGLAGLLFSKNPNMPLNEARLMVSSHTQPSDFDRPLGLGVIDAFASLAEPEPKQPRAFMRNVWDNFLVPSQLETFMVYGVAAGDSFQLDYRQKGSMPWIRVHSGEGGQHIVLGYLDTNLWESSQFYEIRLRVQDGEAIDHHMVTVFYNGSDVTASPLGIGPLLSPPQVRDLNGDGSFEIIAASNEGKILVLDEENRPLPNWPQELGSPYIFGSPAVGNINHDTHLEIIATSYGGSHHAYVGAWNFKGEQLWKKELGSMRGAPTLANLDEDASLEVLLLASHEEGSILHVLDEQGNEMAGWPVLVPLQYGHPGNAVAVADLDGDQIVEIVLSSRDGAFLYSRQGALIRTIPFGNDQTSPLLIDADNNGDLEILLASSRSVALFRHTGEQIWQKDTHIYNGQFAVGVVRPQTLPVLFYAGSPLPQGPGQVYAWSLSGEQLNGWPIQTEGRIDSEPVIADLNADGFADIAVGTDLGLIYAWDINGTELGTFPKMAETNVHAALTVSDDLMSDQTTLLAVDEGGSLYRWAVGQALPNYQHPWPNSRGNAHNSGAFLYDPLPTVQSPLKVFRWIPHISPEVGLFETTLVLQNNAQVEASVELIPYSFEGRPLESRKIAIPPKSTHRRAFFEVFPEVNASHLAIDAPSFCNALVDYLIKSKNAVATIEAASAYQNAFEFALSMQESFAYSLALVNIGSEPALITFSEKKFENGEVIELNRLQKILPAQQKLHTLLSSLFQERSNQDPVTLNIESDQPLSGLLLRMNKNDEFPFNFHALTPRASWNPAQ